MLKKKVFTLWQVLLVRLFTGYPYRYCPPMVTIDPQSVNVIRPLVWPVAFAIFLQGFTWQYVARSTDHSAINTIVFPPFKRVELCLRHPDQPSRSCFSTQNA